MTQNESPAWLQSREQRADSSVWRWADAENWEVEMELNIKSSVMIISILALISTLRGKERNNWRGRKQNNKDNGLWILAKRERSRTCKEELFLWIYCGGKLIDTGCNWKMQGCALKGVREKVCPQYWEYRWDWIWLYSLRLFGWRWSNLYKFYRVWEAPSLKKSKKGWPAWQSTRKKGGDKF